MHFGTGLYSCISSEHALYCLQCALDRIDLTWSAAVLHRHICRLTRILGNSLRPLKKHVVLRKDNRIEYITTKLIVSTSFPGKAEQAHPRLPDHNKPRTTSVLSDEPKHTYGRTRVPLLETAIGKICTFPRATGARCG